MVVRILAFNFFPSRAQPRCSLHTRRVLKHTNKICETTEHHLATPTSHYPTEILGQGCYPEQMAREEQGDFWQS